MALSLLGFNTVIRTQIGQVLVDATLSESHRYPAQITENPVEDGTVYADHVVLLPIIFEMEGRISDATQTLLDFRGPGNSDDAFKQLVELQKRREVFSVITSKNTYQNMMFEELEIIRVPGDGRSMRFTASIREILIVGDQADTNRDRIAADVQYTALLPKNLGLVAKVAS